MLGAKVGEGRMERRAIWGSKKIPHTHQQLQAKESGGPIYMDINDFLLNMDAPALSSPSMSGRPVIPCFLSIHLLASRPLPYGFVRDAC